MEISNISERIFPMEILQGFFNVFSKHTGNFKDYGN